MTADLVQAVRPFVGRVAGNRVLVRAGDLYPASDAVVAAFPDKFREPKVHTSPDSRPQRAEPQPEPNAAAMAEFAELRLTNEADVVPLSEALAKLDEVTLAALYAEYEVEEDTPEQALVALAATRVVEPPAPTKKELLELAAERGIEVPKRATNAEIQAALDAG